MNYELEYYQLNNKNMNNGIFKLDWVNIKSALVYGGFWALLTVLIQIQEAGSIYGLDWKTLLNAGILAFIAIIISLVKNLLTTNSGNFAGVVKVIPDVK